MSVAGILASSLFSGVGSQIAHNSKGLGASLKSGNLSSAQLDFSAIQQKLSALGSPALSAQMTQLGQDLSTGNVSAAKTDFNNVQSTLTHSVTSKLHSMIPVATSSSSSSGQSTTSQLTAALQAYSALQQNPLNGSLNNLMIANPSTFSISA
jgi:hypothetical protein